MKILGKAGLTPEDFDFDPDNMIPAEMPDKPDANKIQRAKWFQSMLKYRVVHGSLHEITQQSVKLTLLQLQRSGMMISWGKIAEVFNVENFVKYPDDLNTEFDKWAWEQEQIAAVRMKIQGAAAGGAMTPEQQNMMQLLQGLMGGNGGNGRRGRKPTGQQPPQIVSKDGGTRQTISESGG